MGSPEYLGTGSLQHPFGGYSANSYCAGIAPFQLPTACNVYDPMSMNGSLYGTDLPLTGSWSNQCCQSFGATPTYTPADCGCAGDTLGMAGMYPGMGMGFYSPDVMMQYQDKWTDYMMDRNARYTEKGRNYDYRLNSPVLAAQVACDNLKERTLKNDQSQIKAQFEVYKDALKTLYPEYKNLSERELNAMALRHYQERNGSTLKDDIRANSLGEFGSKFWQTATLGLVHPGSAEETLEQITGQPMSHEDKVYGTIGRVAGAGAALTVGFNVLKPSSLKAIGKFAGKNPWMTTIAIGAAIYGLASDAIGSLFK